MTRDCAPASPPRIWSGCEACWAASPPMSLHPSRRIRPMTADTLWQDWARAEGQADIAALDRLLTPGFRGVGPVGFVLDKARWLQRFADGLVHESIELE